MIFATRKAQIWQTFPCQVRPRKGHCCWNSVKPAAVQDTSYVNVSAGLQRPRTRSTPIFLFWQDAWTQHQISAWSLYEPQVYAGLCNSESKICNLQKSVI